MKKHFFFNFFLIAIIIIVQFVTQCSPNNIESFFTQAFYKQLDHLLFFTNYLPFSIGDFIYLLITIKLIFITYQHIINKKYKLLLLKHVSFILLFYIVFTISWGLNNYKIPLQQHLNISDGYTQIELDQITHQLIEVVNKQNNLINKTSLKPVILKDDLEVFNDEAKKNYKKLPHEFLNVITRNTIHTVKPSLFSVLLSYMGFSGYFNPFTHENQINYQIPTIGKPITVAHEMAHQQGIASESEANFYGYIVMKSSEDVVFQYAANLYALKYCLKEYRNKNEETYLNQFQKLNLGVQENILESENFWKKKRNISSFIFKNLYSNFLKLNNQKDGIKSYNKFVDILIKYNKKYPLY